MPENNTKKAKQGSLVAPVIPTREVDKNIGTPPQLCNSTGFFDSLSGGAYSTIEAQRLTHVKWNPRSRIHSLRARPHQGPYILPDAYPARPAMRPNPEDPGR